MKTYLFFTHGAEKGSVENYYSLKAPEMLIIVLHWTKAASC